jgi:DNA-directed RNA polymerase subunit M/transcription elongation factor TFIIS
MGSNATEGSTMEDPLSQRTRFRCPLCGSHTYSAVQITLKNGTRIEADFYHCTECMLHFVHPERFMRSQQVAANEALLEPAPA